MGHEVERKQSPEPRHWTAAGIGEAAHAALTSGPPPSAVWSLLLDLFADRVAQRAPADVLRQFERDGFVRPAPVDQRDAGGARRPPPRGGDGVRGARAVAVGPARRLLDGRTDEPEQDRLGAARHRGARRSDQRPGARVRPPPARRPRPAGAPRHLPPLRARPGAAQAAGLRPALPHLLPGQRRSRAGRPRRRRRPRSASTSPPISRRFDRLEAARLCVSRPTGSPSSPRRRGRHSPIASPRPSAARRSTRGVLEHAYYDGIRFQISPAAATATRCR